MLAGGEDMSATFDPAWLALREPVDHRSRAAAALSLLASAWQAGGWEAFAVERKRLE